MMVMWYDYEDSTRAFVMWMGGDDSFVCEEPPPRPTRLLKKYVSRESSTNSKRFWMWSEVNGQTKI